MHDRPSVLAGLLFARCRPCRDQPCAIRSIALLPGAGREDVAVDIEDGAILAVEARRRRATRAHRRHRAARPAERAQPHLPARHGRPRRAPRSAERQLLDLAAGHVPLPRPADARRHRGHRGLRDGGDAGGRASPRSASSTTSITTPTGGLTPSSPSWPRASPRRRETGIGPDAPARSSMRKAASAARPRRGTAALPQRRRGLRAPARGCAQGDAGARRCEGRHRAAQPARRDAGHARRRCWSAGTEGPIHIHAPSR